MSREERGPARDAILRFHHESGVQSVEAEAPGGLWNWPERHAAEQPREQTSRGSMNQQAAAKPSGTGAPQRSQRSAGAQAQGRMQPVAAQPLSTDEALKKAESQAAAAQNLETLIETIGAFDGCPLRQGASKAVVFDGVLGADVLVIGEAPGREEDRLGKPFVGRSGQLLDKMLAAIGLSRQASDDQKPVCITNVVFWRPPGNRNPTKAELAVCLPFVRRFVQLSQPKLVLTAGKVPTEALFPDVTSIVRARGQFRTLSVSDTEDVPALPIFHPAFLLRQPQQKRLAWRDLLAAQSKLNERLP